MSAELAAKYGDVLIQCPVPGQEHLPPERLGDFIQTEVGQRVLGESLANVQVLTATGMGEEQALTIALGPAAVRDETGAILRDPKPDPESDHDPVLATQSAVESTESKKK